MGLYTTGSPYVEGFGKVAGSGPILLKVVIGSLTLMTEPKRTISIWFFIGVLLFVYGVLAIGADIYYQGHPLQRQVELSYLRPGLWWGALLVAMGVFYTVRFRPGKR